MKIGYSVEGSTDRALLEGLRQRWCPQAQLLEGHFRGTTGQSRRREIPRICVELESKGVDCIIFLTDSNVTSWRGVLRVEQDKCRPEHRHITVFGVCLRNVECWLAADADHIANQFARPRHLFSVDDPKGVVEAAFGVSRDDRKEAEIAAFVRNAPLRQWLNNPSFEEFYESLRQKSLELGCHFENLREN
jgi:hypothetical protein